MSNGIYDIITVGGGLGGAALAKAMAAHGARVLVLEREQQFKDRVRGEQMHPWGVAEAKELGLYELLRATCGHELPWYDIYMGSERMIHRNLVATTSQQAPEFSFYHPAMQEIVLQAAADAGAEVRRGAVVREVKRGGANGGGRKRRAGRGTPSALGSRSRRTHFNYAEVGELHGPSRPRGAAHLRGTF